MFKPNIPTDPADIAKVHAEIAMRRSTMEAELLKGVRDLETIRAEALAKRRDATPYQAAYLSFRQAEIDAALSYSLHFKEFTNIPMKQMTHQAA